MSVIYNEYNERTIDMNVKYIRWDYTPWPWHV